MATRAGRPPTAVDGLLNPRTAGPVPWKPMVSLSGPTSLPIEFDTDR